VLSLMFGGIEFGGFAQASVDGLADYGGCRSGKGSPTQRRLDPGVGVDVQQCPAGRGKGATCCSALLTKVEAKPRRT
jgi:hypothetical protein